MRVLWWGSCAPEALECQQLLAVASALMCARLLCIGVLVHCCDLKLVGPAKAPAQHITSPTVCLGRTLQLSNWACSVLVLRLHPCAIGWDGVV